jgi:hypothetical protein
MSKKALFDHTYPSRCCDIEGLIALYPAAIIALSDLVTTTFTDLLRSMSEKAYRNFIIMLGGIIVKDVSQNPYGIADTVGFVSHDSLRRVLAHKSYNASLMMVTLLNYALEVAAQTILPSWLILDDVLIDKRYARKVESAYWDYDYVNRRNTFCIRLVYLVWTNGLIKLPVAFIPWHKEGSSYLQAKEQRYRTKNELARILVYKITRSSLRFNYLTFDNWYSSRENLRFFIHLRLTFYTNIKSTTKIKPEGFKGSLSCKELVKSYYPTTRHYHYYQHLKAHARGFLVAYIGDEPNLKLVVVKNYRRSRRLKNLTKNLKGEKDPNGYLLTNALDASVVEVIKRCRSRWDIEVFFRDLKTHLGLNSVGARKVEQTLRHISLIMLGYVCLEIIKGQHPKLTIGDVKRDLQRHYFVHIEGVGLRKISLGQSTPMGKELLLESLDPSKVRQAQTLKKAA